MVLFKKSDLKRILKGHCERKLSGDKVRLELLEQCQDFVFHNLQRDLVLTNSGIECVSSFQASSQSLK